MLKTALFDCVINEKCCNVDRGWGICLFFSSPPPGICHPRQKKNANAEGQGWGEGLDTAGIDRCITLTFAIKTRTPR